MIHFEARGYLESALTRETASRETAKTTVQVSNCLYFSNVILFYLFKGTVRPDWIYMRVVSLESPLKAHQPL